MSAHPRPAKTRRQTPTTVRVTDWIGGICYADTLQVWFPAHWALLVIRQLQGRENGYSLAHSSWFDQTAVPDHLHQSWQDVQESKVTSFKVGKYGKSVVPMLSSSLRVDWFQLPVQNFFAKFPTLKEGAIAFSRPKMLHPGRLPELKRCKCPCSHPSTDCPLFTVWPDISMMGSGNLRKVVGHDLHEIRTKYQVPSMGHHIPAVGFVEATSCSMGAWLLCC